MSAAEPLDVAIIGAGFAGIGTAIRLRQKGITDFAIFERGSQVGGTWRDNTYPGAACDIPSRLYSYSFAPNPDWSHTYSGSSEILDYIESMVDEFDLRARIRFGHNVTGTTFDEASGLWTIDHRQGVSAQCRRARSSSPLDHCPMPVCPNIPGIEDYQGHKIHSARWDHDYDFTGKTGRGRRHRRQCRADRSRTGAVAPTTVKVFQRTPGWVLPRVNRRDQSADQAAVSPAAGRPRPSPAERWFWGHESVALGVVWNTPLTRVVESVGQAHLRPPGARPVAAPPAHPGVPRRLQAAADDQRLLPGTAEGQLHAGHLADRHASAEHGIRTAEGIEHQFDAIVFATGFDVSKTGTPDPGDRPRRPGPR